MLMNGNAPAFAGTMSFPLLELGLSQIYLNESKICAIEKWFDVNDMGAFGALPVRNFGNGRYTLTDGHTRAYVAYRHGLRYVPIIYDNDDIVAGELGQNLYRADIQWCDRFHIDNIARLSDRILSNDEYRRLWIGRCDRSYNLIAGNSTDGSIPLAENAQGLFLYGASENLSELYYENADGELFAFRNGKFVRE